MFMMKGTNNEYTIEYTVDAKSMSVEIWGKNAKERKNKWCYD